MNGFTVVENMLDSQTIETLTLELKKAIEAELEFHGTTAYRDYGLVNSLPMYGEPFLELLDNKELISPYEWVLDRGCIVHVYMSSSLPPSGQNFASRIHVDRPWFSPGFRDGFDGLIMLTDFTVENGATWVLPGSHVMETQPTEDYFYKHAKRLVAKAGSVFYFDPRLWHAAGVNTTSNWRYGIAIGMIRPYIKQKFDLPRMLKDRNFNKLSEVALQKLGFHSIPPASLQEYYAPLNKRTYKQPSEWEMAALKTTSNISPKDSI